MKLWKTIKKSMLKYPKQKLCENDVKIDYSEAISKVNEFSKSLIGHKCCAIVCEKQISTVIALFSCFAANVTAVPLSLKYGEIYCNKIIDTISPTGIITDVNGKLEVIESEQSEYKVPKKRPAVIMCTSGTTGKPKGVMLSEKNILVNVRDILRYLKIDCTDRILISRPIYHSAVLTGELLTSIIKGLEIHFMSEKLNPKKMLEHINSNNITIFCGTPTLLTLMAKFKRNSSVDSLKTICISGECMDKSRAKCIRDAFNDAYIYHVYGLTEASPRVSYLPPELFDYFPDSVGFSLRSVSLKIVSQSGKIADIDEEGMLWVKGRNVMLGYYNDEMLTNEKLKKGWLCTGDIATIDKFGLLRIKGRADDLIIRAGMNIYPQEIESALRLDSRVKDVVAFRCQKEGDTQQIYLKICGDFSSVDDVRKLCAEVLPDFQMPNHIVLVNELPKNASYKVIRR